MLWIVGLFSVLAATIEFNPFFSAAGSIAILGGSFAFLKKFFYIAVIGAVFGIISLGMFTMFSIMSIWIKSKQHFEHRFTEI